MEFPLFCKVFNLCDINLYGGEIEFALITGKGKVSPKSTEKFLDHNGGFWDCAVPLTIEEFNDPIKSLVEIKLYNYLIDPPEEIEHNVALNLLIGCQNCED